MSEISEADRDLVVDLVSRSELESIDFHELSARRHDDFEITEGRQSGGVGFSFQRRFDAESFGVRAKAELHLPIGEATVCVAASYRLTSGPEPSERAIELFANEVAIMAMFPYIREGISSVTSKVFGAPITLPVAQRGQLGFDVDAER